MGFCRSKISLPFLVIYRVFLTTQITDVQGMLFHCVKPLVSKKSSSLSPVTMKNNHSMSEGLQPLNRTAALSDSHKYATPTAKELCTKGLHNIMVQWSNVEY